MAEECRAAHFGGGAMCADKRGAMLHWRSDAVRIPGRAGQRYEKKKITRVSSERSSARKIYM
jgi:hypothetical protein